MTEHTESVLDRALAGPRHFTRNSVVNAREALTHTAALVGGLKRPTERLSAAGLRMNTVAHDGIGELIRHQVAVVDGALDDTSQRLRTAAEAGSFASLVSEQVAMLSHTRSRLLGDLITTINILDDTRRQLGAAMREELTSAGEAFAPANDATIDEVAGAMVQGEVAAQD